MPIAITLTLILLAGFALGVLFFGGLWLTVRALPKSRHPVLLVLTSFWGRAAFVITGLILAMNSHWQKGLACMLGFVLARVVLARMLPGHSSAGGKV